MDNEFQLIINQLKNLARSRSGEDQARDNGEDFIPDDYAGGNIDDAYSNGYETGQIDLARTILSSLNIAWTTEG